jgi:hypothetical protein
MLWPHFFVGATSVANAPQDSVKSMWSEESTLLPPKKNPGRHMLGVTRSDGEGGLCQHQTFRLKIGQRAEYQFARMAKTSSSYLWVKTV